MKNFPVQNGNSTIIEKCEVKYSKGEPYIVGLLANKDGNE